MSDTSPLPDDLPVLTEAVGDDLPLLTEQVADDLPTLTEILDEAPPGVPADSIPELPETAVAATPEPAVADEMLIRQIEAHIESVFMPRLRQRLEQAQQRAFEETLAELKTELPQLLRDSPDTPR